MRLKIVNWLKYQHYNKRRPPWIKLHTCLFDSPDWVLWSDESKLLAIATMMIAARDDAKDGSFLADPAYVQHVAALRTPPDFQPLLEAGFLEYASTALADANKMPPPIERERGKAKGRVIKTLTSKSAAQNLTSNVIELKKPDYAILGTEQEPQSGKPPCPYNLIIDIFNQSLPQLPKVRQLNETRKKNLKARWRETGQDNLDFWRKYFRFVSQSDFLMGRSSDFQATFDWLIKPTNMTKVKEGNYNNRETN